MANNTRKQKALVKRDGFFKVHFIQAKKSFLSLWERPLGNILTLAVIAMALSIPASVYLVGKNIAQVAQGVSSHSQISVFLAENTAEARVMVLKDEFESWPDVHSVKYISSQQGLEDLSEHAGFEQALSLLDDYSLPAVLVVEPAVELKQEIKAIAQRIQENETVSDVRLDEDWLKRLDAIYNLARAVVATLAVLMFASVFLIVGNTLRFTMLAHKEEIQVMKLIGATDSFILRPYLYSGMWFGLMGAVIAWILTAVITILLNGAVESLALLYDSRFRLIGLNIDESVLLLMLGVFLGLFAARMSAKSHLKEIEPV
ncbi:permease-like cell division protein FtsX [Vibrio sp. JC009]|uniref:permease-like cell division protein FtsX n=1 Tax=Vibrio sp. JC009 TaxID=2912314 RepID=UPI0023AFC801|nr:permease-like cell division protein FtsX [Vibrio sp. JC009]WED21749.1 permease-like cell division protein FtsX [Vibrio sp. JC009]